MSFPFLPFFSFEKQPRKKGGEEEKAGQSSPEYLASDRPHFYLIPGSESRRREERWANKNTEENERAVGGKR